MGEMKMAKSMMGTTKAWEPTKVKTSIGRGMLSLTKMNKKKRASYKKYRGQGKAR
jgi:hypothetical protein